MIPETPDKPPRKRDREGDHDENDRKTMVRRPLVSRMQHNSLPKPKEASEDIPPTRQRPENPYNKPGHGWSMNPTDRAYAAQARYQEVVRNKEQRRAMNGYSCTECEAFFTAVTEVSGSESRSD